MVDENRAEGTVRDIGGKLQDAAGGLMGNASAQVRGKMNQAAGQAEKAYGQAVDEVRDFASDNPVGVLLVAMGVGVMLGFVLGRR